LTARDILLAPSDQDLNEFFGLKKLATFRDPEKKRRDKKRLGKKARLREWRRGTFGREFEKDGPTYGFERFMDETDVIMEEAPKKAGKSDESGNVVEDAGSKKKKRKRSKGKNKGAAVEEN
jgi:protein KRI1